MARPDADRSDIAAAPAAAGEGAVLAGFGVALLALLMWLTLRGLKGAWQLTFSPILEGIAAAVRINVWKVHLNPAGALEDLDHAVIDKMSEAALGFEQAMGFFFHQSAHLQGWIAHEVWTTAKNSYHFGDWLIHTHIPTALRYALDVLFPWPKVVRTIAHLIRANLPKVTHIAHAAAHAAVTPIYRTVTIPHLGEIQWIHRHWKTLTAALATAGAIALHPGIAIPRVWHGIDELKHRLAHLEHRLHRVEGLLGATVLAAAMANVLGLKNPRCLRSGPVGRTARALCGMSRGALDDLLGLLVDVLILEDICQVIPLLEDGLSLIEGPLNAFIGGLEAALCHGDYDRPPQLSVAALSLPPVSGLTLSLP